MMFSAVAHQRYKTITVTWLTVLLLCVAFTVFSQDRKMELELTKQKIEKEIALTNELLEETRKSKSLNMNELTMLQGRIRQRENLIATLGKQIELTDGKLQRTADALSETENKLKGLKKEYAGMIAFAYKNRNGINQLMFIFAANDFNQAYRRLKYLQQYSALRQRQMEKMTQTQTQLAAQKQQLEQEKAEKLKLLEDESKQKTLLTNEKKQLDQSLIAFTQKEKNLQSELRQKEQEANKLQKQIEAIIADEIEKTNARNASKPSNKPDKLMNLTPEEQLISNEFTQNRGRLPWPVERGVVAASFGKQPHPVLKKVTINNNGIDIACPVSSRARAVFQGVVISVAKITPTNNAVIIRHGDYFSVYSNLDVVTVKRGDQVTTRQDLGRVHTDKVDGKTLLHFEIWQGKTLLNPALWLAE